MSADAAISETLTRRPALPRYSDYLRSVIALGRRAIRPALPAIGFLYFYRLGMGIFLEFSSRSAWPPGETDRMVFAVLLTLGGLLPLLALIYTPFLPLQDALFTISRRGTTILLVEQSLDVALALSNRLYVMDQGRIQFEGTPDELRREPAIQQRFLGV